MAAGTLATLPAYPNDPSVARIMHRSLPTSRTLRFALAVLALAVVGAALTGTAAAKQKPKQSCAKQVIADWYDDGRVGKLYKLECYRQAIASLPSDVIDYFNAKQEIGRALAYAKQGKPDPGGKDPSPETPSPGTGTGKTGTGKTGTGKTGTGKTGTGKTGTGTDTAGGPTDTSGPSSIPIPLFIIGGLAILLVAAGTAGYLRRRGSDGDSDGTPPASA